MGLVFVLMELLLSMEIIRLISNGKFSMGILLALVSPNIKEVDGLGLPEMASYRTHQANKSVSNIFKYKKTKTIKRQQQKNRIRMLP